MENKKFRKLSIAAIVISVLPLATFIPSLLNLLISGILLLTVQSLSDIIN